FSFNHTATTDIYTLSLHDAFRSLGRAAARRRDRALRGGRREPFPAPARRAGRGQGDPSACRSRRRGGGALRPPARAERPPRARRDRKSTRLNSSHVATSYAVVCL